MGPSQFIRENCPLATASNDGLMPAGVAAAVAGIKSQTPQQLVDGVTINTNATSFCIFYGSVAGDSTLADPTGLTEGDTLLWDMTLGVGASLVFGSLFKWSGGAAPTIPENARSLISALYRGGVLLCTANLDIH